MLKILKSNISEDVIYESWVKESHKVFSKFTDDDFFSDKVEHIYFYSDINDESVNTLQLLLMDASKTTLNYSGVHVSPKPICLHLNSPGGLVNSTNIFYTLIQSQRVPLCVIIETLAASAATDIALLAPYRIMIDFSNYLIHDSFGEYSSKTSNKISSTYQSIHSRIYYEKLIKNRTKLTEKEIQEFIERDIYIDAEYCLNKNIIDRILYLPQINTPDFYSNFSNLQLNLETFLKKTNLNHLYISEQIYNNNNIVVNGKYYTNSIIQNGKLSGYSILEVKTLYNLTIFLDYLFLIKKDNVKPIVLHFKPREDWALYAEANPIKLIQLNYRLAMIQKRIPIIAFIEGQQYFDTLSTILMCPIRIMMKPSIFQSTFSFNYSSEGYGYKTIDIIDNSLYIFNNVIKLYKKISNLPDDFYKEMRHKIINLTHNDLLKYNIIQLCLNIHKHNITPNDIVKYLQLNKLTGINGLNKNVKKIIKNKQNKKDKKYKQDKQDK